MLMGDGLRRNAWKFPLKIAAKDRSGQITYGELNARVNQLAHGLLALGVRKGDGVALSVGNRIEHLEIIFATAKIGALAIPLDVKWKALELASVVSAFEPRFIILQEDCAGEFAKAKELKDLGFLKPLSLSSDRSYGGLLTGQSSEEPDVDVSEDDPFAVMLTSGTTGFPKGCLTTQRTFVFHCINNAIEKGLGAHDTAILSSPIYFNAGRSFTLGIIYFGGTMILHERFDAEEVLRTIEREKVTYIGAVPTMCERMLHVLESKKYDTSYAALSRDHRRQGSSGGARAIEERNYAEHIPHLRLDGFRADGDFEARRHGMPSRIRRGATGLVRRFAHCR